MPQKSTETKALWGSSSFRNTNVIANGLQVSFYGDENVLEIDNGDDCTTLLIY